MLSKRMSKKWALGRRTVKKRKKKKIVSKATIVLLKWEI